MVKYLVQLVLNIYYFIDYVKNYDIIYKNICIENGYLAEYLNEHRSEVEKIMITMLSLDYIRKASERTKKIKEDISFVRFLEVSEEEIKDAIIRKYDLTPTYAQNFLDDDSDSNDSRPWAI